MNASDRTAADLSTLTAAIAVHAPTERVAMLMGGAFTVSFETGRKYTRVVVSYGGAHHRSCWGFIDLATNEIFKSASWKGPAKGVRAYLNDPKSYAGRISAAGIS